MTDSESRISVSNVRSVTLLGVDEKPALTLTHEGGEVQVAALPRNNSRRSPVRLHDLRNAVEELAAK